jgi:hypothetical protein
MCEIFRRCLIKKMEYEELQINNALSLLDFDFSDNDDVVTNISEYITDVEIKDVPIIKEKEKEIELDWTTMDDDIILPMVKTKTKTKTKIIESSEDDKKPHEEKFVSKFGKSNREFEKPDKKIDDTIPNKKVLRWRKE